MARKKRMLVEAVKGLDEEEDAKFITQILAIVKMHKQRRKEKDTERR